MSTVEPIHTGATPWAGPYFEAVARNELTYQECDGCARRTFPPRRFCPGCASEQLSWRTSVGTGRIYSFTKVDVGALPEFADQMPYVIAVVELDDGYRMLSRIVDSDLDTLRCDDRVSVVFGHAAAPGPCFRRA